MRQQMTTKKTENEMFTPQRQQNPWHHVQNRCLLLQLSRESLFILVFVAKNIQNWVVFWAIDSLKASSSTFTYTCVMAEDGSKTDNFLLVSEWVFLAIQFLSWNYLAFSQATLL